MRSFFRSAVHFFVLLGLVFWGEFLCAQTIEIKLLNGKNGHPMAHSYVNVWVGKAQKTAMVIPTDGDGIARLRLTEKDADVNAGSNSNDRGSFVVQDPVVKYSDSLRVNAGYVLCQPHGRDYSWLSIQGFSTNQVIQKGVVTPNSCGKATASPEPGELIIFVRPLSFWEQMKE